MNDEELLSVGQFARLAGLSPHSLRHYDAVQLLPPDEIDPQTGYRRYARSQLANARLISELRWLSMPIHQVREVISDPDSSHEQSLLAAQADRLVRERNHLDRQIAQVTELAKEGIRMPAVQTHGHACEPTRCVVHVVGNAALRRLRGHPHEARRA